MKRFMLFTGDTYYPNGGMKDFRDSFDTFDDALAQARIELNEQIRDFAHIFDKETGETSHVAEIDNWS